MKILTSTIAIPFWTFLLMTIVFIAFYIVTELQNRRWRNRWEEFEAEKRIALAAERPEEADRDG